MKKNNINIEENKFSWKKVIIFMFFLWISSILINSIFFSSDELLGNVAVIDIKGVISSSTSSGFMSVQGANPDTIISFIDEAENNPRIRAVVFEVNSGGGSPVASDEIAQRINRMNKTNVAFIKDISASGAYWISASTDYILANRMSLVGSIGVTAAYLSFEGLLDDYNVTYNRVVAGKYKDMGTPFKELTGEEKNLLDVLLDELKDEFIIQVSTKRGLSKETVEGFATGEVWTGKTAMNMGLVDGLGSEYELTEYLETELNQSVEYVRYVEEVSLKDLFTGMSTNIGRSIGEGISNTFLNAKSNTLDIR